MMTIVSRVTLREGAEPEWDDVMRDRLAAARQQPGWVSGQLMIPLDALNQRVIIGSWQTRADWEAWHNDAAFRETRRRLDGLEAGQGEHWWHEVIADGHRAGERRREAA
jgi:heme-degrading monooxygenase HmoA